MMKQGIIIKADGNYIWGQNGKHQAIMKNENNKQV